MTIGLDMIKHGFRDGWFDKQSVQKKRMTYNRMYGSYPEVHAVMWEDHMTTDYELARIDPCLLSVKKWLRGHARLRHYDTDWRQAFSFCVHENTVATDDWIAIAKIAALKKLKIIWPYNNTDGPRSTPEFGLSIDGVHVFTCEPDDPEYRKNPKYYSHKFEKPGLSYEIALSLSESKVIWVNGPFPAGTNDLTIFREELVYRIPIGIKAIVDRGYRSSELEYVLTSYNGLDDDDVNDFKKRALSRHESFNKRIKNFEILTKQFRHSQEKNKAAFEAVCVTVQYQMEKGWPLFEI